MKQKLDKTKIAVIHFQPVELYPPAMNLINYLGVYTLDLIFLFSNKCNTNLSLKPFSSDCINVEIVRPSIIHNNALLRYYNYIKFFCVTFFYLLTYRPAVVLYFETISSLPALLYKRVFKNVKLLSHYHEYTTPEEYREGMRLSKWMHKMEIEMYQYYNWISHTNSERLNRFRADCHFQKMPDCVFHEMPNYPPADWRKIKTNHTGTSFKLVCIGSLGLNTSYLKEVVSWAIENKDSVSIDFYSFNIKEDALKYILNAKAENIQYKGYSNYFELPEILKKYHCGIVLHKPATDNYLYNAPNKIFEYLACGLDVIIPDSMIYACQYVNNDCKPRVVSVDFLKMDNIDLSILLNNNNLPECINSYTAELVYANILTTIQKLQKTMDA